MTEFWQKYRDPRWQKRRLEKFQHADFTCEHCRAADQTLHVHHKIYRRGAAPWEYELQELELLCDACHSEHHEMKSLLQEALAIIDRYAFHEVVGYAQALAARQDCTEIVHTLSPMHADGVSAAFADHDYTEVLDLPKDETGGIALESLWRLLEARRRRTGSAK